MTAPPLQEFLERVAAADGYQPLSDAKMTALGSDRQTVIVEERDSIVAVGVVARHEHADGSFHWAVETVLEPGLRFPEFEEMLLTSTAALVPPGSPVSVWSRRPSLDRALETAGFRVGRELAYYTVRFPLGDVGEVQGGTAMRTYVASDAEGMIALNRAAFEHHREAAELDVSELERLLGVEGMGPEGILVAEDGSGISGFCWTRIHPDGDGEIYRIAVAPRMQGQGVGRSLLLAAFANMAPHREISRGTLWVDLADGPAVKLYESIGMTRSTINREFERLAGV